MDRSSGECVQIEDFLLDAAIVDPHRDAQTHTPWRDLSPASAH